MQPQIKRVEAAITALKQGNMIILTDHPARENEGDLIIAAEKITPESMNFMIRQGTGIVCLSLPEVLANKFHLPLMVPLDNNTSLRGTPFTVSIDAKEGITTGVSAEDRTKTVLTIIDDLATSADIVKPGHIFPLLAKQHGVLEREGHTEGALDLVKLAELKPAAVLCEIMNADGTMAKGHQLEEFAEQHQLCILSIDDLVYYRLYNESMIEDQVTTSLPIENYGSFQMTVLKEKINGKEHIVISKEVKSKALPTLVRIHSSCTTGDLFHSQRCDCYAQLHYSLDRISREGGILIYLHQEGRGIGLFNKIKAYSLQEQQKLDTVEANHALGFPADAREYYIAAHILRDKKVKRVLLLTNNPNKVASLKKFGIEDIEREALPHFINDHNLHYLHTKVTKLHHFSNSDHPSKKVEIYE